MRPIDILLVEDNQADVVLTQHAFKNSKIANTLNVATDGEIALKMLLREDEYADQSLPDLVILDLNLPKIEGRDVLKKIKSTENLKDIPVVIMSGSNAPKDREETLALHANTYLVKPLTLEKIVEIAKSSEDLWLSLNSIKTSTE